MKKMFFVAVALLVVLGGVLPALAQGPGDFPDPAGVVLTPVADGFDRPLLVTHAGDGSDRLFVVEQGGVVWIIAEGERLPEPFLDLTGIVTPLGGSFSERGLLGLAFHPDYAENGRLFVDFTDPDGSTTLAELAVSADDANYADPDSLQVLLWVEQPFANHNGGHLAFGPDGYLYMVLGDGGSGGDPMGNGQDRSTLLGSILRLDMDGDDPYNIPADNPFAEDDEYAPEIWAWGLRNAWRFSFDRATGDLYIADVGQNVWEEINFQAADSPGGENYGWNAYEGSHQYSGAAAPADMVLPVAEYAHGEGCSVTGGYVYRGEALPDLQGVYFYGDWCTGNIWAMFRVDDGPWQSELFMPQSGMMLTSFGEDEAGELYVVDYNGRVLRFDPAS